MNSYVEEMKGALTEKWPSNQCMVFGHLGDGNLHVVVGVGDKGAKQAVEAVVYEGLNSGRLDQCGARRWCAKESLSFDDAHGR